LYYSYIEVNCYNCKNHVETQDHILQCEHGEDRNNLKKKYLRDLNILLVNNDTHDTVRRIINECVYSWLYNKEIPSLDDITDNPSDDIRYAYNTQTYLGWNQFVRGRLTKRWMNIYKAQQSTQQNNYTVVPDKWGKDIIVLTWRFVMEMWTIRNKIEHSTEDKVAATARKKLKLILKIKWLHEKYKDKLTEYGDVLTMEELEKLPLTNLLMMETQFSSQKLNKKYDIDLRNGGQGDSQT
jgi:hypothetical protein